MKTNNFDQYDKIEQEILKHTPRELAKRIIGLEERLADREATIGLIADKCTETSNSEMFHIVASSGVSANKIKANAVMEAANDILGYSGLTDYYEQFKERANKLIGGK